MHLLNLLIFHGTLLAAWISLAALIAKADGQELEWINFVFTDARLLSGNQLLSDCQDASDENCTQGVAAVGAYLRHLAANESEPLFVLPILETSSQFVRVHPLGWNVNRLILNGLMKWNVYAGQPSLLNQHVRDGGNQDLTYLQNEDFKLLLSNVNIPPSSSWDGGWHEHIHFDVNTGLALIVIGRMGGTRFSFPQAESANGMLYIVEKENKKLGRHCVTGESMDATQVSLIASYENSYSIDFDQSFPTRNNTAAGEQGGEDKAIIRCWTSVIVFYDTDSDNFERFLEAMKVHPHPPAVILDAGENNDNYTYPTRVPTTTISNSSSTTTTSQDIWVHSYHLSHTSYIQHQFAVDTNQQSVQNISFIKHYLNDLPEDYKDDTYKRHIDVLRVLANEAMGNDEIVGFSTEVPPQRSRCTIGQCEIGSLFADAMRWYTQVDIAFQPGGGLRGGGWAEGPVYMSDIWTALPFPDAICTGVLSGVSLVRLLDYSYKTAYFNDTYSADADRLLQVSGMRITYSSKIPQGQSKIVSVETVDSKTGNWTKVQPLNLYSFATIDFLCKDYHPFPELLGQSKSRVLVKGEVPGNIEQDLLQDSAAWYLAQIEGTYTAEVYGRLIDDPEATEILRPDMVTDDCEINEFYSEQLRYCIACPDITHVSLSDSRVNFQYQIGRVAVYSGGFVNNSSSTDFDDSTDVNLEGRIVVTNRDLEDFQLIPRSFPAWLEIRLANDSSVLITQDQDYQISAGSSIAIGLRAIVPENPRTGIALGTVSIGIVSGLTQFSNEAAQQCNDNNRDLTFEVVLDVRPAPDLNHLGKFRYVGLSLMAIIWLSTMGFAGFVIKYRKLRIVKVMQPLFLGTICLGLFILASVMLPFSFDDGVLTQSQCDAACTSIPWLVSSGCCIIFSSLFSKLWRINKLFHTDRFRRVTVTEKDVIAPFLVLFSLNVVLLITWTIVDPLQWSRRQVDGEEWKTYGVCASDDIGYVFLGVIAAIDLAALLLACYQAYKARDISGEFSESKNLGLALFTWLQVLLVGIPSLFLVDPDNFTARYFLIVGLLFVLTESMLLVIFVPLVVAMREYQATGENHAGSMAVTRTTGRTTGGTARTLGNGTHAVSGIPATGASNPGHKLGTLQVLKDEDVPNVSRLSSASMKPEIQKEGAA